MNTSGSPWLKIEHRSGLRKQLGCLNDGFNNPEMVSTENGCSNTAGNLDDMSRMDYDKHSINNVLKGNPLVIRQPNFEKKIKN